MSFVRLIAAVLLVGAAVSDLSAAELCPFMTQGSAAKLLGGEVSAIVKSSEDRDGTCSYTRLQGPLTYILAITVHKIATDACPEQSTRLKAVGNEAMTCRIENTSGETIQRMSGRVRDMFFTISLTARGPKSAVMPAEAQRQAVEQAAEQVTGNLY
jgi:hypothetical protein